MPGGFAENAKNIGRADVAAAHGANVNPLRPRHEIAVGIEPSKYAATAMTMKASTGGVYGAGIENGKRKVKPEIRIPKSERSPELPNRIHFTWQEV